MTDTIGTPRTQVVMDYDDLTRVMEEMADKISVVKVNVDDADEIAAQYRIMSIPTLLFIKNGQIVDKTVGAMPKPALVEKINANL